jgi:hypothetical protein
MFKRFSYIYYLALVFIAISVVTYSVHYIIFRDVHHIFIYLLGDLAFLPLQVLLVVLIIERVLSGREKRAKLEKLNMIIGAFFSELGNYLLSDLLEKFDNRSEIKQHLNISDKWTQKDFLSASKYADRLHIEFKCRNINMEELKLFLSHKREFILNLMSSSTLLEHDRFTDLLWAITHLDEELASRPSLEDLPDSDLEHIAIDIQRFYDHLVSEWLDYIKHLKENYPFLYSLVLRTHPFQENPSAIVN